MSTVSRTDSEKNDNRNSASTNLPQSDGSTIIRRTIVERNLRPAAGSTANDRSSNHAAITTIARQHQDEQRELQELNAKFSVYLDRVQYLEDHNQRLTTQLTRLKETWGGDAAQIHTVYGPQLKALRDAIDNALRDQALQELQLKRHEYDLWQIHQQIVALDGDNDVHRLNIVKQQLDASYVELEHIKTQFDQKLNDLAKQRQLMENLLNQINGLKNELDNQQLERLMIENELQTLQEHAAFQDAIYQTQREDLLSLGTPVLDVSGFYRSELARAIFDIRQDFEVLSHSQLNELEEYYRIKTEQIRQEIEAENERRRLLASEGVIESMDKTVLTSSLKDNQDDLLLLQNENKQLQTQFDAIIDDLEKIQDAHLREKQSYENELIRLRERINDKQNLIDSILENNVSLRFELSTYRRLLDVEEKHMNKMEHEQSLQNSLSSTTSGSALATGLSSFILPSSSSVSKSSHDQTVPNRTVPTIATKKMTVQKTARGPISFETIDFENDSIVLVNEKYSGNEQSFQNWTIRRQIDQQADIVYQFPSTFTLRPRQRIVIYSRNSLQTAKSLSESIVAENINSWGIGQKMVTRLIDNNNEEKAVITQIFQ